MTFAQGRKTAKALSKWTGKKFIAERRKGKLVVLQEKKK
jgi:hypothetical protein